MTAVTATTTTSATRSSSRRLVRAGSVVAAGGLNGVVFLAAKAAGTAFVITDPVDGAEPHAFTVVDIALVSVVFALLGWAALALFERFSRRAARNWTMLAVAVTLLSMVPIGIEIATAGTRVMLAVIHTLVLVALIPALRTARS
jgi:heme A synthase